MNTSQSHDIMFKFDKDIKNSWEVDMIFVKTFLRPMFWEQKLPNLRHFAQTLNKQYKTYLRN